MFLGVVPSEEVRTRYASFVASARARLPGLRWVLPQNLHLTMRFLGETSEVLRERLEARVAEGLRGVPPLDWTLGEPGTFGRRGSPRVLLVHVAAGATALEALADQLEAAALRVGFARAARPWTGHLTLARNPQGLHIPDWKNAAEPARLEGLRSSADRVILFASRLQAPGGVYSRLREFPLEG